MRRMRDLDSLSFIGTFSSLVLMGTFGSYESFVFVPTTIEVNDTTTGAGGVV